MRCIDCSGLFLWDQCNDKRLNDREAAEGVPENVKMEGEGQRDTLECGRP